MIVSPRFIWGRTYFERKKNGWIFVSKVLIHCSLYCVKTSSLEGEGERHTRSVQQWYFASFGNRG